eukprot:s247_g15.t1
MAWKVAPPLLLAALVRPVLGTCKGQDLAQVLVSEVGSCKTLTLKEEQLQDVDCIVAGDSTAKSICKLLFKMRSDCAIEKLWLPLGELVRCLKAEDPAGISSLYPIMDQLGDLPVNDKVQGAMKAFMNQMLAHMFSPGTDLSKKTWTQHAFCEARLALTYRYEYEEHLGALSALNQVCVEPSAPLRLFASDVVVTAPWRSSMSQAGLILGVALVAVAVAATAVHLKVRRRTAVPESESEALMDGAVA